MKIQIIPEDIQYYLSSGVSVLPHLHFEYLKYLYRKSQGGLVCLTPSAALEYYDIKINKLISDKVESVQQRQRRGNR